MSTLVFNFLSSNLLSKSLIKELGRHTTIEIGEFQLRDFPDGETYLRVLSKCQDKAAVILANLHQPNDKLLPLIFLCETLKESGVEAIHLLCPYLPYMRQDIQFHSGECVTSRYFARLLSQYVDSLTTIDPHLHRYHSLEEIYTIKTHVVSANPLIANWVKAHIKHPLVVGPDSESEQWAAHAADMIGCPYIILEKQRSGDKNVKISTPHAEAHIDRTPVLIDDIISTGRTMIVTADALVKEGFHAPVCIGVHALFSQDAFSAMNTPAISEIITCNTVKHATNKIDTAALLIDGIAEYLVSN